MWQSLLQKIRNLFTTRRKHTEISRYIKSIERDEKGRWVFPDKVSETPVELLGDKDWAEVKKVLGDAKTWKAPCMCGNVDGDCVC